MDPMTPETPATSIDRTDPTPPDSRRHLVGRWTSRVRRARGFWNDNDFRRMRSDMAFCAGRQWENTNYGGGSAQDLEGFIAPMDERYVANITLRHIQSRTASIYGKNPKFVAKKRPRLLSTVWDGTAESLASAKMQAETFMAVGMPPPPEVAALIMDAQQAQAMAQQLTKMGRTLEILFDHELKEQPLDFKVQMKATVRKGLTTSVGYVKLGYQRVMARRPEVETQMESFAQRLAELERLSADLADGIKQPDDAEAEELRNLLQALSAQSQITVREGLTISYPDSTAIIIDPTCRQLRGFVGAGWVAEEYFLTADDIKRIYQKDVTLGATASGGGSAGTSDSDTIPARYTRWNDGTFRKAEHLTSPDEDQIEAYYCVWEIYSRVDGMVYTVCDGYGDFLAPVAPPDVYLERFYPWFAFVVNETYDDKTIFPPSDVYLMRNPQMELNRSRQGLREHRMAAVPKTFVRRGVLTKEDKEKLATPTPHEVVELDGLAPNEKIDDLLQGYAGPQINPALYDPSPAYEDYLRVLGQQEANLGATSGATATEASIAEGSRVSTVSAVVDDLDEFLTELAHAAGQILLLQTPKEKVVEIVGPGAVWPELTKEQVARDLYLDVQASSTGRPNRAQEVQVAQQVYPLLMQMPDLSPEMLAQDLLHRLDDSLEISDFHKPGTPSIQMLNRPAPAAAAGPGNPPGAGAAEGKQPEQQGQEGGNNAPATEPEQVNAAPRPGRPPMVPLPANPGGV